MVIEYWTYRMLPLSSFGRLDSCSNMLAENFEDIHPALRHQAIKHEIEVPDDIACRKHFSLQDHLVALKRRNFLI